QRSCREGKFAEVRLSAAFINSNNDQTFFSHVLMQGIELLEQPLGRLGLIQENQQDDFAWEILGRKAGMSRRPFSNPLTHGERRRRFADRRFSRLSGG